MIEKLTVKRALEFAIKTEQLGASFYEGLVSRFSDDAELKEIFQALARDEQLHENQFKALRSKLGDQGELGDDESEYLRAIAMAEIFHGGHEALDGGSKASDRDDALQRAHEMEKTTLLYYMAMREVLGAGDVLDSIIEAEKRHLKQVTRYLLTGAKMRGLADEF